MSTNRINDLKTKVKKVKMMAELTVVFLTSQFGCLQVAVPSPPSCRIASKIFPAVPRIAYCGVTLALVTMVTIVNLPCTSECNTVELL